MRYLRYLAVGFVISTILLGASVAGTGPIAHATTGPSQNLPPTFKVKSAFARQFIGQYVLISVPSAAKIKSAALGIEVNDSGTLYGIGQFYGYDPTGAQTSWVASLYHFRQSAKTQMSVDLLAPADVSTVLGRLVLTPPQHANLSGKIVLEGHSYPIAFHQISTR